MSTTKPIALNSFDSLGVIEIAHIISLVLFGIATAQVYYYYQNFPDDRCGLKLVVAAIWVCALGIVACDGYGVILFSITPPGSFVRPVAYNAALVPSRVMEFLIQAVYSYRVYRFSGRAIIPIVSSLLSVFAIVCAVFSLAESFSSRSMPIPTFNFTTAWPMASIYITNAVVSSLIAITMVYYLLQHREHGFRNKTRRQVDRLIVWTLQSGLVPSIFSIAGLICFVASPNNQAYTLLLIITPALSANGLYALLNDRRQLRAMDDGGITELDTITFNSRRRNDDSIGSQNTDTQQQGIFSTSKLKGIRFKVHEPFPSPIPTSINVQTVTQIEHC